MLSWLWLVPTVPFGGFLLLSVFRESLSRRLVAMVGAGSVGLSAVVGSFIAIQFVTEQSGSTPMAFSQVGWTWVDISHLTVQIGLYLDAVSTVMMVVVTSVAFLIHLYSIEFMKEDESYARFFAYMNLFVGAMLLLVLADNFLLLLLGWEGVGMCSYLLIGFWYREPANGRAAQKAFLMTRLADTAFIIGMLIIFTQLETLHIQTAMQRATEEWSPGSSMAMTVAALLLVGAIGKSAQIPLQTWLPDAMAGPTPVSALIHAATMVTAGVYLLARLHELFALAPVVQFFVGLIGGVTLLLAAAKALVQQDAKRILAYSTISQIGYMFLALGVGAVSAALFHFLTHAMFKALLFLVVGVISLRLHHEHNIMKMGGLRHDLPLAFWTFLIGSACLAGFPFTAGFFSKDLILWEIWAHPSGSLWLWGMGMLGVFFTALYSFRAFFFIFYGEQTTPPTSTTHRRVLTLPLLVLAGLSLIGGWIEWPQTFGDVSLFREFIHTAIPEHHLESHSFMEELAVQLGTTGIGLLGIFLAYVLVLPHAQVKEALSTLSAAEEGRGPAFREGRIVRLIDWFLVMPFQKTIRVTREDPFDRVYATLIVHPYRWLARMNKDDFFNHLYDMVVYGNRICHQILGRMQTGQLGWYARMLGIGAVVVIGLAVFS